ncbi:hypothetical protein [Pseudoxanthomonas sp.]|uniref:hypothetical protein n=1 Tax=Pseudoxanthomonas sp. TaxID=1871049 RepID=UPI002586623F|nr:hypothetical protein [Pseudoxanthomonas sp.]MCR6687094.1 hypothetical protein [Pseudoxanthomonas sp.]
MTAPAFALAVAVTAYALVAVSLLRVLVIWLDWRDARRVAEFRAQQLVADAESFSAGRRRAQQRVARRAEWGRAA